MTEHTEKFAVLAPFMADWALPTEQLRSERRWASSPEEFQAFYDATLPLLDELLAYFDKFKVGEVPEDVLPLYHLTLAFAEASPHVEMYQGSAEVPFSFSASRFVAAHADDVDR
jgi:hypothetical protein